MERFTVFSEGSYEPKAEITTDEAIERLGIIEDLIESGELMPPDIKQDDTVYFIYKNAQVLEGAISGRALYDGRIDPAEALALLRAARR